MNISRALLGGVTCALVVVNLIDAGDAPRTGSYSTTFSEGSPLSAWPSFVDHLGTIFGGAKNGPEAEAYRISEEPFDIYVPSSYDGSQSYGLIAFVSPNKGGGAGGFAQVCDEHKLIWIGAANVPNERNPASRSRITVDGVFNICKLYHIDRDRIYVAGFSGGGRVASHIAVPYAEVFTGGALFICGCDALAMPPDSTLAQQSSALSQNQRFAFITGSDDSNRDGTKSVFHQYQSMKLPMEKYFEEPGLGHSMPSVKWFTDAIIYVDGPLITKATAQLATAKAAAAKQHWREAWTIFKALALGTVADAIATEAKPLLADASVKLDEEEAKEFDKLAKPTGTQLRQFVSKWPSELPTTIKARAQAEAQGGDELDKLVASKPAAPALRAFLKAWDGYDICARALTALDGLAKVAWEKVDALKPGDPRIKAIVKFINEWAPTPTATSAGEALVKDVQGELTKVDGLSSAGAKNNRLQSLLKEVTATSAATVVQAALNALNPDPGEKKQ